MTQEILDAPAFAPNPDMQVTHVKMAHVSQPEDRHVTRPPRELPFLIDGDMLEVHNDGEVPFKFRWARKETVIEPHGRGFVLFEAAANQLGDPRSVEGDQVRFDDGQGNKGIVLDRYAELCRLFAMYAVREESIPDLVEKAPKLRLATMTGVKVNFPIHVPDMRAFPVNKTDKGVTSDVARMYQNLQEENEELRERTLRMERQMDELMRQREGADAAV